MQGSNAWIIAVGCAVVLMLAVLSVVVYGLSREFAALHSAYHMLQLDVTKALAK